MIQNDESRLLEKNDLSFKESRILHVALSIVIVTFLFSALPEWSAPQFKVNAVISFLLMMVIVVSWKAVELKVRYFSIQSYCLIFCLSHLSAQPIIKYFWQEGNSAWIYFASCWIVGFIILHFFREGLFQAFSKIYESKFSIGYHIVVFSFLLLVPIIVTIITVNELNINIGYGMVLYVLSIILLVTLPAFLKRPEEIKIYESTN
ncbi:hypothetical protein AAEO50_15260 [Rossellomorea oryzaecorticis]|uniref:Uncharacterized protein n=1 Tax=Rossellomorea oryzaecorticis TaxID=1396505 RepID=A0ABU9KC03_9BACI